MPWNGTTKYALGIFTVLGKAPTDSGLYALFVRDKWVYIGEAENIQVHLLRHLNDPNLCVLRHGVTSFAYERVSAEVREARRQELIAEFNPVCQDRPARATSSSHLPPENDHLGLRTEPRMWGRPGREAAM